MSVFELGLMLAICLLMTGGLWLLAAVGRLLDGGARPDRRLAAAVVVRRR